MSKLFVGFASALLFVLRVALCGALLVSGSFDGAMYGVSGAIVCVTTAWAWCVGRPDLSWTGLGVGVGHLAVLFLSPGATHWPQFGLLFGFLFGVQCVLRVHLGRCCTVTGPVFVCVVDSGIYGVVRHPMTFVEMLMAIAFALEYPSLWNAGVCAVAFVVKVLICLWEEKFLLSEAAYREYAERVRWRWLPGVW